MSRNSSLTETYSAVSGPLLFISTKRNGCGIYNEVTCSSANLCFILSKQPTSENIRVPWNGRGGWGMDKDNGYNTIICIMFNVYLYNLLYMYVFIFIYYM